MNVVPPWPGEKVSLDGTDTFVRYTPATAPRAEPALYVHGLGGSSMNCTDLAYLLSDRLDGEAIDLPGFGYSDPAHAYTVAAMAHRVIRWIEYSGRGPVHLFGNSMGGSVTIRVAATRPDLVRTLTLISPAMPFIDPRRSEQGRLVPFVFIPGVERLAVRRLAGIAPEVMARQVIAAIFAQPERLHEQRLREAVEEIERRYEAPWYARAYLRSLRGMVLSFLRSYLPGSGSLWRIAARITAPTLVITGRQDRIIDVRVAPQVARLIPDSRLLVLDQVGHVAQMEVPRSVARAVLGLLDDARQPRPAVPISPAVPIGPASSPVSPASSLVSPASGPVSPIGGPVGPGSVSVGSAGSAEPRAA